MAAENLERYRLRMLVISIGSAVLLFFLAFLYYKNEKLLAENESYQDLRSIGKLKATQISSWYYERFRDATFFSNSGILLKELEQLKNQGKLRRERILNIFQPVIEGHAYEEILITDVNGNVLFSVDPKYQADSIMDQAINDVIKTRKINTHNLYYCSIHHTIHNDVMAPLIINDSVKALLIMRINPYKFLYPYIQEWPVASHSSESILVTRKGDSVLFLNEMKKVSNLALKYTIPLSDTIVPAVAAIRGKTGKFSGRDYVGDKVLSDLNVIEGTPWHLVVKIDEAEINDEVLIKTGMVLAMVLLTVMLITGGLVLGYKRKRDLYQRLKDNADYERFSEKLKNEVSQRTSELQKTNEDLLNFTHVISHDLKEPLRKTKFFLSLFKENYSRNNKEKAAEYLIKAETSVDRLNAMVEGILNYSEVQNINLEKSEIDLNDCIKQIQSDLELLIESKKAQIFVNNLPKIRGINVLIYKLFYNLIVNALKFSKPEVPPKIIINSTDKILNSKKYTDITISDNGIGFEQEYSEKIFQSFVRLHPKDTYEGTGLGLSLCKKIVERHEGKIFATGNVNDGSTFHVLFPK